MATATSELQVKITAKNEASGALKDLQTNAKELGVAFVAVGGAIDGVMGISIKNAVEAREKIASMDATLAAMGETSTKVSSSTVKVAGGLKLTGTEAEAMMQKISAAKIEIEKKTASLTALKEKLDKGKITQAEYSLSVRDTQTQIEKINTSIADYNGKLNEHDTIKQKVTKTTTIHNMAMDDARAKIIAASKAAENLGFDDEEAAVSIAKLYQHTGNLNDALKLNQTAMDLSAAKGIDLSTASNLVNLAVSGGGRALLAYGIKIKDAATPMEALAELQSKVAGQAAAQAAADPMKVLQVHMEDLSETIGEQLLPIMDKLIQKLIPIIENTMAWAEAHPKITQAIIIGTAALGLLLTVVGGLLLIMPAVTATLSALGVVMTFLAANPIVLIIAAVAALGLALYYIITTNNVIKSTIIKDWKLISDGLSAVLTTIHDVFFAIWDGIKQKISDVVDWVMSKVQAAQDAFNKVANLVSAPVKAVGGAVSGAFNFITGKASGGDVFSGQPYVVGEAGPEMFVPNTGGTIIPNGQLAGAGGGITINITGNTLLSDRVAIDLGNMIVKKLKGMSRLSI